MVLCINSLTFNLVEYSQITVFRISVSNRRKWCSVSDEQNGPLLKTIHKYRVWYLPEKVYINLSRGLSEIYSSHLLSFLLSPAAIMKDIMHSQWLNVPEPPALQPWQWLLVEDGSLGGDLNKLIHYLMSLFAWYLPVLSHIFHVVPTTDNKQVEKYK